MTSSTVYTDQSTSANPGKTNGLPPRALDLDIEIVQGCYVRQCNCRRLGAVPVGARGALAFIMRDDWRCRTCREAAEQAERDFLARHYGD